MDESMQQHLVRMSLEDEKKRRKKKSTELDRNRKIEQKKRGMRLSQVYLKKAENRSKELAVTSDESLPEIFDTTSDMDVSVSGESIGMTVVMKMDEEERRNHKYLVTKDVVDNLVRGFDVEGMKSLFKKKHGNKISEDTPDDILGITLRSKHYIKLVLDDVAANIKVYSAGFYVRHLSDFPQYESVFSFQHHQQDKVTLTTMRQQSHARALIQAYLDIAEVWDDYEKTMDLIKKLALDHIQLPLKLADHQNHYLPLLSYLMSHIHLESYKIHPLIWFFGTVSRLMVDMAKKTAQDKTESSLKKSDSFSSSDKTFSRRRRELKRAKKQVTWD